MDRYDNRNDHSTSVFLLNPILCLFMIFLFSYNFTDGFYNEMISDRETANFLKEDNITTTLFRKLA